MPELTTRTFPLIEGLSLIVGLGLIVGLTVYGVQPGGFVGYHRYGFHDPETSWVSYLAPAESYFFLMFMLVGCAAAGLIGLGLSGLDLPRVLARLTRWLTRLPQLAVDAALAAITAGLVLGLHLLAFNSEVITDDEWVYLFQSQTIAMGQLTVPAPPLPEFYRNQFLVVTDKMYSQYPFGHSAVLALGVLLGNARIVQILMSALTLPLIRRLAAHLWNPGTGLLAAALLLCSPQFLLTGATLLSQVTMLFLAVLTLLLFVKGWAAHSGQLLFAAGSVWALGFHVRGMDTVYLGIPLSALVAYRLWRGRPRPWRSTLLLAAGVCWPILAYLATNWLVNGGPLTTNYNPLWKDDASGAQLAFGFGQYPWGLVHTPVKGWQHAAVNFIRCNIWLLGWPISWLPLLFWLWRCRPRGGVSGAMAALVPVMFAGYFFYFWPGNNETGPIFYHLLLIPAATAGARGVQAVIERARSPRAARFWAGTLAGMALAGASVQLPVQVMTVAAVTAKIDAPYRLMERKRLTKALVFAPMLAYATPEGEIDSPVLGLRNNSPTFNDDVIIVRQRGPEDWDLLRYYPVRTGYHLWRDSSGLFKLRELNAQRPGDNPSGHTSGSGWR